MNIFNLPPDIDGLIFDLDGTLADNMPLHYEAWQKACKQFGLEMSADFLRSYTGTPGINIAIALLRKYNITDIDPGEISKLKYSIYTSIMSRVKTVQPVAEIVKQYHGKLSMAIGSGGQREAVIKTLEYIKMGKYFHVIVSANDVSKHKPDPETFLRCAELMNIIPEKITVFEDGDLGIQAAESAGMTAVDVRPWYDYNW